VVGREKDHSDPAELKETRVTYYDTIKRKKLGNSIENSKHSESIDEEVPAIRSVRQAKERRRMNGSR
jgi:hypothetical protein